jgi:hypothetical protein
MRENRKMIIKKDQVYYNFVEDTLHVIDKENIYLGKEVTEDLFLGHIYIGNLEEGVNIYNIEFTVPEEIELEDIHKAIKETLIFKLKDGSFVVPNV